MEERWQFTGIYGLTDMAKKHETWSLLHQLHRRLFLPWLCTGDFNEILWSHEKLGLGSRQENLMKAFRDVLDECGLMDLGLSVINLLGRENVRVEWSLRD